MLCALCNLHLIRLSTVLVFGLSLPATDLHFALSGLHSAGDPLSVSLSLYRLPLIGMSVLWDSTTSMRIVKPIVIS